MQIRHPGSTPSLHREFLDHALPRLAADPRIVGIAAAGSYAKNAMDAYSDIDLLLACEPADLVTLLEDRAALAAQLGKLVAYFTGEHVGEPRLMICLYGSPALHVDIKVLALPDLAARVDEPVVLWDRDDRLRIALAAGTGVWPKPDPQWIEDRFWVWVHYGALKIARGEFQEALDFLSYLRVSVLGPLGLAKHGADPAGVRRVEAYPELARQLAETVGTLDACSLAQALTKAVTMYGNLRSSSVEIRREAERVAVDFLDEVARNLTRG